MKKLSISEEEKKEISFLRYNHPHPHVLKKMEVLHLKSLGILSHELICTISGVSPNTMRTYFKQFEEGGIEKLKEINFNKPKSELSNHSETIENYLRENPPATTSEAAYMIEQITGIKRGLTQTREFIKSLGVKLRKVGSIPAEALTDTKKKNKKNT